MKKNLLTAVLVAGVLAPLSAQWTQVGGTVKVQPNTLKYVSGNHNVTGGNESNEGNVNVQGNFTVAGTNGVEFRNEFNSGIQYGQLILQNGQTVSGNIHGEFQLNNNFAYHAFGVPYTGYQGSNLVTDAGMNSPAFLGYTGSNDSYDVNRYKNPIFHWVYDTYVFDTPASGDNLNPGEYYEINNFALQGGNKPVTNAVTTYIGTPNNYSTNATSSSISLPGYKVPVNNAVNVYGEAYGTYIVEPFSTIPPGWTTPAEDEASVQNGGYGNNVYYLSNPYTSNIDLETTLNNITDFVSISQTSANAYTREDGNGNLVESYTNPTITITYANGSGDKSAYVVRPYHAFIVKLDNSLLPGSSVSLDFAGVTKTFDDKASDGNTAPTYRMSGNDEPLYQIGMDLYNSLGENTGKRFYVAADNVYQAGGESDYEAFNIYLGEETGVYTLQESEDGSIVESMSDQPVYINGINATKYVGKPVVVGFQTNDGGGTYTLKARLNEDLQNSNYKYFFEDKETGKVEEVSVGSEFTFTQNSSTEDRFVIYWNDVPQSKLDVDDVELINNTLVYKDARTFKVRFNKNWKSADVFVYNMLGQLVHSKNNVDTTNDYVLPLSGGSAAYVVKTIGDNGEIITKKIINK